MCCRSVGIVANQNRWAKIGPQTLIKTTHPEQKRPFGILILAHPTRTPSPYQGYIGCMGNTIEWTDPRMIIQVGVLMANGRLAPRNFADRAEAEAWAQEGEEVVEWNLVCECDR